MKQSGRTPQGLTFGLGLIWGLSVLGWPPAAATTVPSHPTPTKILTTPLSVEVPVDDTKSPYVVGTTASSDFPRTAPFQALPSVGFVAQLSETEPQGADLILTMEDDPDPVVRGETLTYTLTVTNNGPASATGVVVTNTVSARLRVESVIPSQGTGCLNEEEDHVCQLGTLENGKKATITITGTPLAAPFLLGIGAEVRSDLLEIKSTSNNTVVTAPEKGPVADLSFIKTDETEQPTLGAPYRYTLTVTNGGPDTAPNVILTEPLSLPARLETATPSQGTCTGGTLSQTAVCRLGSLAAGTSATVMMEVIPTFEGRLPDFTQVTSSATDPNRIADLSVRLEGPVTIPRGDLATYTITMTNRGPDTADEVEVADQISTSLEFLRDAMLVGRIGKQDEKCISLLDFCGENCEDEKEKPLVLGCEVGILGFGEVRQAIVKVVLPASGSQLNLATLASTTFDPIPENNAALLGTEVEGSGNGGGGEGGGEGGGDDGSCFIATAAFGSPLAKEVKILRHFRDRYLLPHQAGQLLIRGYYYSSPPLANFIDQHPGLKKIVRVALWPVVWWAHLTLTSPNLAFVALIGGFLLIITLLYWVIRSWQHKIGT